MTARRGAALAACRVVEVPRARCYSRRHMTRAAVLAFTIVSLAALGGCEKQSTKSPDADGAAEEEGDGAPDGDSTPDEAEEEEEGEEAAPGLDKPGGW